MPGLMNKNLRIAIFGASSQVGSSVAFYLKHFTTHEPICFIRSKYSAVFFEISNIKTVAININDISKLRAELKNVDVVLDFSLPAADAFEMGRIIKQNLQGIIRAMPGHAIFIYMSSIMAYGMPSDDKFLKSYTFPRALYGFTKRKAEKAAATLGTNYAIPVYNFRLGQVHGFLQSVSESFRDKLSSAKVAYLDGNENDLTNTIFISSLAEAVIECGSGKVKPSTYTLISHPQWTLGELYKFYLSFFSLNTTINYKPKLSEKKRSIKRVLLTRVKKYRPLIETYILSLMPKTSIAIKGKYRVGEIAGEINSGEVSYLDYNLLGTPGLPMFENMKCSVNDILQNERAIENLYMKLIETNTK